MNHGMWIDIFVVDHFSRSKWNIIRQFKVKVFANLILRIGISNKNWLILPFNKLGFRNLLFRSIEKSMQKFDKKKRREAYVTTGDFLLFGADIFDSPMETPFEDMTVKIPSAYDRELTSYYGDWRKLPPPEKESQVTLLGLQVQLLWSSFFVTLMA